MGDTLSRGTFDGKDLFNLAHGAALSDASGTGFANGTLTIASGATLSDQLRNGTLRKNAALDYLQANTTTGDAIRVSASQNTANDPTGINAFNKFDVNHDGLVNRSDALTVDTLLGKDFTSLSDQLGVSLKDNNGNQQSIVDAVLADGHSTVLRSDLDLITGNLVSSGGLVLGDANLDGKVDLTDLSAVLNNFGSSTDHWTGGNFDGAASIDLTDLSDVLNNFGSSLSGSGSSAIVATPEPTSLAALALVGVLFPVILAAANNFITPPTADRTRPRPPGNESGPFCFGSPSPCLHPTAPPRYFPPMLPRPFLLLISLFLPACTQASPTPTTSSHPLRILFIGNSLTYTNDLPAMLQKMSVTESPSLQCDSITFPAASLDFHKFTGIAHNQLRNHPYDVVILQDYSIRPLEHPEATISSVTWFQKDIHAAKRHVPHHPPLRKLAPPQPRARRRKTLPKLPPNPHHHWNPPRAHRRSLATRRHPLPLVPTLHRRPPPHPHGNIPRRLRPLPLHLRPRPHNNLPPAQHDARTSCSPGSNRRRSTQYRAYDNHFQIMIKSIAIANPNTIASRIHTRRHDWYSNDSAGASGEGAASY